MPAPETARSSKTRLAATGLLVLLLTALVASAFAIGFVREYGLDFHWHLMQGRAALATHALYRVDTFSHTFAGHPVFVSSWLGDVLLALTFNAGGYPACYLLHGLFIVAMLALLFREMTKRGLAPIATTLLLFFLLADLHNKLVLRPEMVAFALFAGLLLTLGAYERKGGRRTIAVALLLILWWANFHGSVATALLTIGIYSAERVIRAALKNPRRPREIAQWMALPIVAFAVACINPEGIGGPLSFRILTHGCNLQSEWEPLQLAYLSPLLIVIGGTALATTVASGKRTSPWRAALTASLFVLAFQHRRFAALAVIAAAPLVAGNLVVLRDRVMAERPRGWRIAQASLLAVVGVWSLCVLLGSEGFPSRIGLGINTAVYPESACRFARAQRFEGRMFNAFNIGGYLLYCLAPETQVFIDQRVCSLYPGDFFQRYLATGKSSEALRAVADDVHATWAFMDYAPYTTPMALDRATWRLVWFDDTGLIYVRTDGSAGPAANRLTGFAHLDPFRLIALFGLHGSDLDDARRELARASASCPGCYRVELARAALALASGDDAEVARAIAALPVRDTPERALLDGVAAFRRGDRAAASRAFEEIAARGGDPTWGVLLGHELLVRAGDAKAADALLDEAAAIVEGGRAGIERFRLALTSGVDRPLLPSP